MYPFIQPPVFHGSVEESTAESYVDRVVGTELSVGSLVRRTMKDFPGSRFQIKSAKASNTIQFMEIRQLRQQLTALPNELKEYARTNYLHEILIKSRESQTLRGTLMNKLYKTVRKHFIDSGIDPKSFRIGGNDRRPYGTSVRAFMLSLLSFYYAEI